jgi:LysR family nitrogen assimilation transcriptional regulator
MDLRQLRYFVAIVECGSISRASQQLNIAQPALSLHIRNMEAELDMALLFRTPQGVQPTEGGIILLRNARLIIDQFEQAQKEIKSSTTEPAGEVRLGLPGTINQILGVPLILAARERFPRVRLRIAEAMSGYVLDWLRLGRVDLGVLYQTIEDRGLRSVSLLSETLVLLGPANGLEGPVALVGTVPFSSIASLPLVLPSPGHGLRTLIAEQAGAEGLQLTIGIEIDAYGAIKNLVERGLGFSVLPEHSVEKEVEDGRLRAWHFHPPLMRTVHIVSPTDRPLSHAARLVESLCRTTIRDLVNTGTWRSAHMRMVV